MTAERKYQDHFTFDPTYTLWLAANHKPRVRGQDKGIWRRICLVPFTTTISADSMDQKLPSTLAMELPGILNWALAGMVDWRERGLNPPDAVRAATDDYQRSEDALADFIEQCCSIAPSAFVASSELYERYRQWSEGKTPSPWGAEGLLGCDRRKRFRTRKNNDCKGFRRNRHQVMTLHDTSNITFPYVYAWKTLGRSVMKCHKA